MSDAMTYYDLDGITLYNLDVFKFLAGVKSDTVQLAFLDAPYNIGVFCKMPAGEYLTWCQRWLREIDRALVANGALWICHKDAGVLVDLSRMVEGMGRGRRNWVTWDKYNGTRAQKGFLDGYTVVDGLRSFQVMAEYLVYHADEGEWTAQCDRERGFLFESLRAYLDTEKQRAGFTTRQVAEAFQRKTGTRTVTGAAGHWFTSTQYRFPAKENYQWLRQLFNSTGSNHLARDYDDLRQEYERTRYTFHNPGRVSSVWQIPPASNSPHPTPKPDALLERIITTTSNPGDLILDPFMGSGTTPYIAQATGRRCVANDFDLRWCEYTRERLRQPRMI